MTRWVDRLLPFHFTVQHVPGKSMGFADYFSRYPISPAPQPLESDKNYVVNLINTFKHTLKNAQRISTNQNAPITKHTKYDVTNTSEQNKQNRHAFCQIRCSHQSHSCNLSNSSLHKVSLPSSKLISHSNSCPTNSHSIPHSNYISTNSKVLVCTRNNPYSNTSDNPIHKRPRAKKMSPLQENNIVSNQPQQLDPPKSITTSTQTDNQCNLGKRLTPLDPSRVKNPLENTHSENNIPLSNLHKKMNENFISEAIKLDNQSNRIRKMIQNQDWLALKHYSRYWHTLKKDLSVNDNGCILYDGKLYIPPNLRDIALHSIHKTHTGQAGMMYMAQLIWFPRIHREIVLMAQKCKPCTAIGKNLKSIIPKNKHTHLNDLQEPNEEVQIDFTGPIQDKNKDTYILVSVDRFSRYPHAKAYHNCDTETAIEFLKSYMTFHGIPRSLRCDQAQAFKSKNFEIFCKDNNIKLILAPAGDYRGTGFVERMIQTIKRRLSAINIDPKWDKETLTDKITHIIENIRLIPNTTTRITPFEAHFGRTANTQLTNILKKPNHKNLSYNNIKNFHLDKKKLKQAMLSEAAIWNQDSDSEPQLDIQYQSNCAESDSDEEPLATKRAPTAQKRKTISPKKIVPDKLSITFGDKTSVIVKSKNQVARKTVMRRVKEPRGTFKPMWNIIPDGTITNYTPHTITIDTPKRKDTVIRKSDIAIATETNPDKPRLIEFVACKTVGEYKRNREKIKKFYLDEKKQKEKLAVEQTKQQQDEPQPGTSKQTQQAEIKTTKKDNTTMKQRQKQRKGKAGSLRRKAQQPTKRTNISQFESRSKQAALAQSKSEQAKRRQRRHSSIVSTDLEKWNNSDTVEVINLVSDSPQQSPITIVTSSLPKDFMNTPNKGRRSVERIVQKLPFNKDTTKGTPTDPIRTTEPQPHQSQITSWEPSWATQQKAISTQDNPTIVKEAPVTIHIESDSDHNVMPEDCL